MSEEKKDEKKVKEIVFKNRRVIVGYTRSIQISKYSHEKIHGGFEGDIPDKDNLKEAYNQAYLKVEEAIDEEIKALGLKEWGGDE